MSACQWWCPPLKLQFSLCVAKLSTSVSNSWQEWGLNTQPEHCRVGTIRWTVTHSDETLLVISGWCFLHEQHPPGEYSFAGVRLSQFLRPVWRRLFLTFQHSVTTDDPYGNNFVRRIITNINGSFWSMFSVLVRISIYIVSQKKLVSQNLSQIMMEKV